MRKYQCCCLIQYRMCKRYDHLRRKSLQKLVPRNPNQKNSQNQNEPNNKLSNGQDPNPSQDKKSGNPDKAGVSKRTQENSMTHQEAEQWLRNLRENPKLLSKIQSAQQGRNPAYMGKNW